MVIWSLAVAAALVWFLGRRLPRPGGPGTTVTDVCDYETPGGCPDEALVPGGASPAPEVATQLDPSKVCPTAGYLCSGLRRRGTLKVLRWNEATPLITIRVPRPTGETSDAAIRLQRAAARGISIWNGHPIPLKVVLSDRPSGEDFAVSWSPSLGGLELGRVETRWVRTDGVATLEIDSFALSTRSPQQPSLTLDPGEVTLTAAHEMGHALGLPHSDSERDVMFPTNTAQSLSTRDFRTMEALYSLENGAEIRPAG